MFDAILIAGPTASGKSALALRLAEQQGGEVINADSMQVYKDLKIVTACPSEADESRAPHHLYGYLDGEEVCSAARWAHDAATMIDLVQARGALPIIVGGTGLYFRALVEGLSDMPDIPGHIRQSVRARIIKEGPEALHRDLSKLDPDTAARLAPLDQQRLARALEVYEATGRPISAYQKDIQPGPLSSADQAGRVKKLVIDWPRADLYARCDQRFDQMLEAGAEAEVSKLLERGLPADRPVMKALGVPELADLIRGLSTMEDARARAQMQTRRFAKRQTTWFKNQTPDWVRIDAKDMDDKIDKIVQKQD